MLGGECEKTCKEWEAIIKAPRSFLVAVVIAAILIWGGMQLRYSSIIHLQQRQILYLKERLGSSSAQGNEYSRLTHEELQTVALQFVADLRKFLTEVNIGMIRQFYADQEELKNAKDQNEKQRLWERQSSRAVQDRFNLKNRYDAGFKEKALLLRQELLSRLPRGSQKAAGGGGDIYGNAVNSLEIQDVANDLDRLAQLLH